VKGRRLALPQLKNRMHTGRALHEESANLYRNIADDLVAGAGVDLEPARDLIARFTALVQQDTMLAPLAMNMRAAPDEHLFRRGINTAVLTIAIAMRMGFADQQILHAAISAMFHDAGMLKVPVSIWLTEGKLSEEDWLEVRRHPSYAADNLDQTPSTDETSVLVAYQMHERADGSGYPRGIDLESIHSLARVAGLADSYLACCSWRPHSTATSPHLSARRICIEEIGLRLFDRDVVAAFLNCMSPYPVGSYVRLTDGRTAHVLRSSGRARHLKPVVVPLAADGTESDELLNLSEQHFVKIVSALDADEIHAAS
jgi:HD-GYP domain-containing protein (c-di-GMP phosphodiesterase class II)